MEPDQKNTPVKPQSKISFNHPITSIVPMRDLNLLNSSIDCKDRSNVSNILSSRTITSYAAYCEDMKKSSRMIRWPFCRHDLSQEQLFEQSALNSRNNYQNNNLTANQVTQKKLKVENNKIKNFFLNEKGGVVFKQNTKPTISIRIVKRKTDISKYINESKELGKNKNISVYEVPISDTKIIVRPTMPIVY